MMTIPIDACGDRKLYRVRARNFELAVFDGRARDFIGLRRKVGETFADRTGGLQGASEELPESLPAWIPLDLSLGPVCGTCHAIVASQQASDGKYSWHHISSAPAGEVCSRVEPLSLGCKALTDWLKQMETRY